MEKETVSGKVDWEKIQTELGVGTAAYNERVYQHALNWLLLENYLKANLSLKTIEHTIRFVDDINFIIHPSGKDGSTIDFELINKS